MSPARRAMLLMAAFSALWAAIEGVAAGVLQRHSPWQVVWTRYAAHVVLMLLVWGWREPASLLRTRRPVFQLARALLMVAMPGSWVLAQQAGLHPQTLMAIFWVSPLLIVAFAALAGERSGALPWLAALGGYAGTLLLHPPARITPLPALAFAVSMAASFALYVVMTRSLRTETTRANLFYTAFGVLLALTPALPAFWTTPTAADLLVMVTVGVLGFGALYLLDRLCATAPVSPTAPFAYLQGLLALGASLAIGTAGFSPRRAALGGALIALACLFLWVRDSRPRAAAGRDPAAPTAAC